MKRNKKGFSLVELIVVISIMGILLGLVVPSVNALFGYEAQKATGKITALLDDTKVEAMNRIVAEMELKYVEGDGYYIIQYLDYGKEARNSGFVVQETKVASNKVVIRYKRSDKTTPINLKLSGKSLILTFNRETGGFRKVQEGVMDVEKLQDALDTSKDIPFQDGDGYCEWIEISCGLRTRTIYLQQNTGGYIVKA